MTNRIGLITWFDSYNYGTCLQCYALSKYLNKKGYEVYIPDNLKYYYGMNHPIETLKKIRGKITDRKRNKNVCVSSSLEYAYKIRRQKNHVFAYTENKIYRINSRKEYYKMLSTFDTFITGSDQIWNPYFFSPTMLLSFTDNRHKRISYSSSLGVSEIPKKFKKVYKKYLSRFDTISVREKTAENLIKNIVNKEVVTVLDPTFLLNGSFWKEFAERYKDMLPDEDFIFCYFIGKNISWHDDIKKIDKFKNVKIITALSESNIIPDFGEIVPDAGVGDFVSFISNARCVVTDSFHAVALSINMNKDFIVYKRFVEDTGVSQNSRIYDLLKAYGLENRIINNKNTFDNVIKNNISYKSINEKLDNDRTISEDYLMKALKS